MSEPKFTKGTWTADVTRVVVGKTQLFTQEWWDSIEEMEEAKANAYLAAAAPELYDFVHFFETFAGQCYCKILGEAGQKIYDEAVKICKKARGEE